LDLEVVYWSTWGLDWEEIGASSICGQVTSNLSAGAVILLHDTARYGRRASATATADALPQIVAHGEQRGLTWTTLTEAVHEAI
jgi:peptidoglycan/xylan/chitin deacetylase (PgdA/CDA1 family)